ncbi:uncharacterized protein LOC123209986 isoform X2 [Mangifera indica]|uniref:uncharacterized protein LOC123209986 isoform X2 n=1 Tax=Mangifera indica TaxID=29780 RepID=UPI001CFA1424|nr:uncharacterized protein LOC123209986 isoform X2 [Mangifera indica]
MKGTKRFAPSESASEPNDTAFRNKRILAGSPFDLYRTEPSQQQSTATPPLDMQRAESSHQHVRALNTQFASWVQSQLKNHPDELWEDGVRDYLTHASNIMEKFSDVVNWLKANASKGGNFSSADSHTSEKKLAPEIKNNELKPSQEKTFAPATTTSFGIFSSSQPSVQPSLFFGNQSSVFMNHNVSNKVDGGNQSSVSMNHNVSYNVDDDELPQPSSPSLKKSEEKGIVVVHEVKCKLYVKSSDPADKDAWKDKGTGQLSIKCKEGISKGTKESKPTILVRNDVGKLLLNALLYPGIRTNLQKNSLVAIFHTSGDDAGSNDNGTVVARTFLIRTKTDEDRNKLAAAIKEYSPAS